MFIIDVDCDLICLVKITTVIMLMIDDDDDDDVLMFATAAAYENGDDSGGLYCGAVFDNVTCWPDTKAGHLAAVPCPTHYRGLQLTSGRCEIINSTYFYQSGKLSPLLQPSWAPPGMGKGGTCPLEML